MKNISLTETEWSVMECLWEKAPRIGREIIDCMEEERGWNRSTTLTLLKRLENKGAIVADSDKGIRLFSPIISREDAALHEATGLLDRVYKGSLSMLVSTFAKKQSLSNEEIDELYAILENAKEANK